MSAGTTPFVTWHEPGGHASADPGATLALDRAAWESLGAHFEQIDDGQGETPLLATASVMTSAGAVTVGVLDFAGSATYLLVPGPRDERRTTTEQVLRTLADSGAIRLEDDVVDVVRPRPVTQSLEQRVAHLERQWEEVENGLALLAEGSASEAVDGLSGHIHSVVPPLFRRLFPGDHSDDFRRHATGMLVAMQYARYMADREAEATPSGSAE